ncbi:MAG: NeuD/PglB/VioB family sugar acetyltransferase [Armatimonadota bacterium]
MGVTEVRVPRETVSDEQVVLACWYVDVGEQVEERTAVASVEASKAVFDIEAGVDGFIFYVREAGDEIGVGDVLAVVANTPDFDYAEHFAQSAETAEDGQQDESHGADGVRFSRGARRLIDEHGLDVALFAGRGLVTEDDVTALLAEQQPAAGICARPDTRGDSVIIIGGGGHAKMCIDVIRQQHVFEIAGVLDDGIEEGEEVLGVPVIGPLDRMEQLRESGVAFAVNGIGAASNHPFRSEVFERIKSAGFAVPSIIHPDATVEPSAVLGEGNQIMAGAIVGSAVTVGDNCIVNSGSVVSHDSVLADNVHIAPGAILAGGVRVGSDTLVGMGVTIYLGVELGERVVVVNGQHVFENVRSDRLIGGQRR